MTAEPTDDPMMTNPLIGLEPLREEAERLAKELFGLVRSHTWYASHVDAFVVHLADLTRPASRDFWARWLAEAVELEVGATAPTWCLEFDDPEDIGTVWLLRGRSRIAFVQSDDAADQARFTGLYHRCVVVPGIATIIDPARALEVAIMARVHDS